MTAPQPLRPATCFGVPPHSCPGLVQVCTRAFTSDEALRLLLDLAPSVVIVRMDAPQTGQWLDSWNLSVSGGLRPNISERVLFCEDDIEVSPYFWRWLKTGHTVYANRSDIAGFTLQRAALCLRACADLKGGPVPDGTNFLYALVGSWGFSPTPSHWIRFTHWARSFMRHERTSKPYVDGIVTTSWYKAFENKGRCPGKNCMWTQLHIKYTTKFPDRYTVYAKCPIGQSLASNHREAGLHYAQKQGNESRLVHSHLAHSLLSFPDPPSIVSWDGRLSQSFEASEETTSHSTVVDAAVQLHANQSCQDALGWTPLMIVNEGYLVLLENWLQMLTSRLPDRGRSIRSCTLFVAIDDRSWKYMVTKDAMPWVSRWGGSSATGSELKYGSSSYFNLMSRRLSLINEILLRGVDVALIEVSPLMWLLRF